MKKQINRIACVIIFAIIVTAMFIFTSCTEEVKPPEDIDNNITSDTSNNSNNSNTEGENDSMNTDNGQKSNQCEIISAKDGSGTEMKLDGIRFHYTGEDAYYITGEMPAGAETGTRTLDIQVSAGATWKLYSALECTNELAQTNSACRDEDEITSKILPEVAPGYNNKAYIEVTSEDGTNSRIYRLWVTGISESADKIRYVDTMPDIIYFSNKAAADNDELVVMPGTYFMSSPVAFMRAQNVTLRSLNNNPSEVIFKANGIHVQDIDNGRGFNLMEIGNIDGDDRGSISNGITVRGITFRDSNQHGIQIRGENGVENIVIDNCVFMNVCQRMIKGSGQFYVRNLEITNCHFENEDRPTEEDNPGWGGNYVTAIDIMALDNAVISDNSFLNINGADNDGRACIFIWVGSKNITAERNLIINCDRGIAYGNPSGENFTVDGGIIRNNIIWLNDASNQPGIEIAKANDILVIGNTVNRRENTYRRGITDTGEDKSTNITVANNLVRGTINDFSEETLMITNVDGNVSNGYFEKAKTASSAEDMRLTENAANALGKGTPFAELSEDFFGNPRGDIPDIGAHQFSGTAE